MKTILSFFVLLFVSMAAMPQETSYADFPVTTKSSEALKFYNQGIQDYIDVKSIEAEKNFTKAAELDPDFVMANYRLAMNNLSNNNMEGFKSYANKAINSKGQLNESEKLMQQALRKMIDNPKAEVTEYYQKLVELNPKSYFAHQMLANAQNQAKDYEASLKTLQSMLSLTDNPAPVYNSLGYTYMSLNQMDKAKESFEKYIQADPDNANAYDSMGDYYAKTQDFDNAQQSYMRAYQMDSVNFEISHEKAEKIKEQVAEK